MCNAKKYGVVIHWCCKQNVVWCGETVTRINVKVRLKNVSCNLQHITILLFCLGNRNGTKYILKFSTHLFVFKGNILSADFLQWKMTWVWTVLLKWNGCSVKSVKKTTIFPVKNAFFWIRNLWINDNLYISTSHDSVL